MERIDKDKEVLCDVCSWLVHCVRDGFSYFVRQVLDFHLRYFWCSVCGARCMAVTHFSQRCRLPWVNVFSLRRNPMFSGITMGMSAKRKHRKPISGVVLFSVLFLSCRLSNKSLVDIFSSRRRTEKAQHFQRQTIYCCLRVTCVCLDSRIESKRNCCTQWPHVLHFAPKPQLYQRARRVFISFLNFCPEKYSASECGRVPISSESGTHSENGNALLAFEMRRLIKSKSVLEATQISCDLFSFIYRLTGRTASHTTKL